jgi:glutamine amidotransferase
MIAIIDYGAGNLRSIRRALEAHGADTVVTADPLQVAAADAVVLPGVGAAGHSMRRLADLGLIPVIHESVAAGTPFLGICLGMQLLFEDQEEGNVQGLGLLPGRVRSLRGSLKVPHMGWNQSRVRRSGPIGDAGDQSYYYFVHSYIVEPQNPDDIAATAVYGDAFPSIVIRDQVWGTQFHPEKSGDAGLALIGAFVEQLAPVAGGRR